MKQVSDKKNKAVWITEEFSKKLYILKSLNPSKTFEKILEVLVDIEIEKNKNNK